MKQRGNLVSDLIAPLALLLLLALFAFIYHITPSDLDQLVRNTPRDTRVLIAVSATLLWLLTK